MEVELVTVLMVEDIVVGVMKVDTVAVKEEVEPVAGLVVEDIVVE